MRLGQIVVDCRRTAEVAEFWGSLLGGTPVERPDGWTYVEPPGWPRLLFQPVPEAKTVKNRLHLDVVVDDIPSATTEAVGLGAVVAGDVMTDEHGSFRSCSILRATSSAS
ncbi:hypothetical protein FHS29_004287 [Saccharothrix tamanrassetensis]|uniref:Glyoxalase-like domain-containing protein n=1 Tax=Saccharothrix tamanrassetensis TaxID=1051531 RepID=A0A841CGP0_9PSEU|nr:VOC family protein [Saccharothrix tamanrassetensis]MBB5957692.1 hypothetical protein [Saccharothrix tamanrassetensis]